MRVLHVQRAKGIGGSERQLVSLLPVLQRRGTEVRMCVLAVGAGDRFVAELRQAGIDTRVHAAGPDVDPRLVAQLYAEIRAFRPDVVHTHLVHADVGGQLAARAARVPGVSSMHETLGAYRREPYHSVGRGVGRLAARRIAISQHVASFIRELRLAPVDRVRVVPYGIDAHAWEIGAAPSTARRGDAALVVGIAARLVPGKGHEVLFEAAARAYEDDGVALRVLVAGEGPERQRLQALAATLGRPGSVEFLGFVDDVPAFLARCDVLAFPTLAELGEGFGLAALEAMAAGRPVVASAVGSLPEVVDDGTSGLLVEPGSADRLRSSLVRLARDPALRERLGRDGAARARDVFSLEASAARTVAVYEEIA